MNIAQSDDTDPLLRNLDMVKDDTLEVADAVVWAPDPALSTCVMPCNGQRWMVPSKLLPL